MNGGSVNAVKSNINSNFQSVNEQSGLKAGDGGFQVNAAGNTALVGSVIASTQAAVDANKNSFTTGGSLSITDKQNSASYSGNGYSVGASFNTSDVKGKDGSTSSKTTPGGSAGVGSTGGNAASTSSAGISGIAGNTAVRTGDANTGLTRIFDAEKVQREINAQVAITGAFGQQASKAIGDYAATQTKLAETKTLQAKNETDPVKKAALEQEAQVINDNWGAEGRIRILAHTVVGGLTGGLGGAAGRLRERWLRLRRQARLLMQTSRVDWHRRLLRWLVRLLGRLLGGGINGAATAFNEVTNNYLTHTQITARDKAIKVCQANGNTACEVKTLADYDLLSAKNSAAIKYGSVLSESSLQAEKSSLQNQLNDTSLSPESRQQVQRSIKELDVAINVIQKSPVLKDAAVLGLVMLDVVTLGALAATRILTTAMVKEFITAKTGTAIADDTATRIALNFYKDGGVDLAPQMYKLAGETSTHNPQAAEVVLGRYIFGSPQSYEQVARTRGATYFEMGDWNKAQSIIGPENMWNINKSFLDQQIAQGKSFVFTADPALANVGSLTNLEFNHLRSKGYTVVPEKGGLFRAVK